jgi:hypothetical protein
MPAVEPSTTAEPPRRETTGHPERLVARDGRCHGIPAGRGSPAEPGHAIARPGARRRPAGGALHEIGPAAPRDGGAATGLATALTVLALREGRQAVWIRSDFGAAEAGELYGPGLALMGLALRRLIVVRVPRPRDALWAMEETLQCRAVGRRGGGASTRRPRPGRLLVALNERLAQLLLEYDPPHLGCGVEC